MMKQKLPWIIVAVLAGLLIIITALWMEALSGGGNISAQKDTIREACAATDEESRARCQQELADLEAMLRDFAKDLNRPAAEVQLVATTTATTTLR